MQLAEILDLCYIYGIKEAGTKRFYEHTDRCWHPDISDMNDVIIIDEKLYERWQNLVYIEENGEIEDNADFELSDDEVAKAVYDKQDVMLLLKCKSDKALKFLKLCHNMRYATKIGNQYYIKHEDFDRFFDDFKGKEVAI